MEEQGSRVAGEWSSRGGEQQGRGVAGRKGSSWYGSSKYGSSRGEK